MPVRTRGWCDVTKRWQIQVKLERFNLTRDDLGLPESEWTEEKSEKAVKAWKAKKKAELTIAQAKLHPHHEQIQLLTQRFQIAADLGLDTTQIKAEIDELKSLSEQDEAPALDQAAADKVRLFEMMTGKSISDVDPATLNSFFGSSSIWGERKKASQRVEIGNTVGDASKQYILGKQGESRDGSRSADGADNIRRWLAKFVKEFGELTAIDSINFHLWERWQRTCKAKSKRTKTSEAKDEYSTSKAFVKWLWQQDLLPTLPKNFDNRMNFKAYHKEIEIYEIKDVKQTLALATGQLKLHLLLMLNCGMTQKDISDLKKTQIDFKEGTITRRRSKTEDEQNTPLVCYPLWKATLKELKANLSEHPTLALTTKSGQAWVRKSTRDDGGLSKADNVATLWRNLKKANPEAKFLKTLISLKKTSSSLLVNNPDYTMYHRFFLGHSEKAISGISYAKFDKAIFAHSVEWLAKQYGVK